jgi:hypothetical protein
LLSLAGCCNASCLNGFLFLFFSGLEPSFLFLAAKICLNTCLLFRLALGLRLFELA